MKASPAKLRRRALWAVIIPAMVAACCWLLPVVLSRCDLIGPHHECYFGARDVTPAVLIAQFGSTLVLVLSVLAIALRLLVVAGRQRSI